MDPVQGRWVVRWYGVGAVLVALTLIIGGVTRLTDSGLSMVEWSPILGVVPPMSDGAWEEAFDLYRAYPQYQLQNRGMSLSEFKFIFFWEYLHRMAGRTLGVIFLVPFGFFLWRGWLDRRERWRATVLLFLGASQGVLGWFMVMSGLVDVPWVSHFRLAAHLMLAVLIFLFILWFALDLAKRLDGSTAQRQGVGHVSRSSVAGGFAGEQSLSAGQQTRLRSLKRVLWGVLGLTSIQMVWGAFVAGLHAGHIYNTFPRMAGEWIPTGMGRLDSLWLDLVSNPATVQWVHRVLGTLLLLWIVQLVWRVLSSSALRHERRMAAGLLLLVLVQYLLGVLTLLYHVPLLLGVLHQFVALLLAGYMVLWIHRLHSAGRSTFESSRASSFKPTFREVS